MALPSKPDYIVKPLRSSRFRNNKGKFSTMLQKYSLKILPNPLSSHDQRGHTLTLTGAHVCLPAFTGTGTLSHYSAQSISFPGGRTMSHKGRHFQPQVDLALESVRTEKDKPSSLSSYQKVGAYFMGCNCNGGERVQSQGHRVWSNSGQTCTLVT